MNEIQIHYPVANIDITSNKLGNLTIRYYPTQHTLQWPDKKNTFGNPKLSVHNFYSPNPTTLQKDLTIRIQLVEMGLTFIDICTLDSIDLEETPLTNAIKTSMPQPHQHQFEHKITTHDENNADTSKPISIINYK